MSDGILFILGSVAVRWQDILDIIIVAYLIYRLVMLIRGTIAVQMVFAILFLFALLKISSSDPLELHALHWLLQHFWSVALVAVIVIFQPEFRRALMEREVLDAFNLTDTLEIAEYSLSELRGYIVDCDNSKLNEKDAEIFYDFSHLKLKELIKLAKEIDKEYESDSIGL